MKLISEKIILREPYLNDYYDLWINAQDKNLPLYTNTITDPFTQENAQKSIQEWQRDNIRETALQLVIEFKKNKEVIGVIGLKHINKKALNASLSYWIGIKYRQQGIATIAITLILKYAFEELKLEKIYTRIAYPNRASYRIMEKFGFKQEGYAHRQIYRSGIFMDRMDFGLLKEEYYLT